MWHSHYFVKVSGRGFLLHASAERCRYPFKWCHSKNNSTNVQIRSADLLMRYIAIATVCVVAAVEQRWSKGFNLQSRWRRWQKIPAGQRLCVWVQAARAVLLTAATDNEGHLMFEGLQCRSSSPAHSLFPSASPLLLSFPSFPLSAFSVFYSQAYVTPETKTFPVATFKINVPWEDGSAGQFITLL